MSPAERLARAVELLDQGAAEIEDATEGLEEWALDSVRFLLAVIRVCRRRVENVRKVLGSGTKPAA